MKVLGIYGSPRKAGNSDLLLDAALEAAAQEGAQVERLYCRRVKTVGCLECGGCDQTGVCVVSDGMDQVYPLLDWAQSIILASPIFFYNLPAQCKAVIDRAQAPWNRRLLAKGRQDRSYDHGRGWLIAVGASGGKNLFTGTELTVRYFYDALDMSYQGGLLFSGLEDKGAVKDKPQMLDQARRLGRQAAEPELGG